MARRNEKFSLASIYEDLRQDFRAGKDTRFVSKLRGVSPMGSGADYHYRSESQWLHMLERCRHYQRDDQVVGQAVRRLTANIVQDGFRLDPNTGDDEADADIKAQWAAWSTDPDQCHNEGEMCFSEMESTALSSIVVDGDTFCLPLQTGALQWVEAHRCRTPRNTKQNVVHGVLLDENARRMQYWFARQELGLNQSLNRVSDVVKYDARDPQTGQRQVLHLYFPYRFSQRRGISALAPVSDTVGQTDDVLFATLVKSQIAALIAILHQRDANWQPVGNSQKGPQTEESVGGFTRTLEGCSAGLEIFGEPGETLSTFSSQVPSPEFFPHTMMLLRFIAINLDMPVHVLLLDPSQTNFSGWRGAIDQARLRFRQIQDLLIKKFHTPVYRWWLAQRATRPENRALLQRIQSAASKIFDHRWNPPQFPYIEPLTDAQADDLQQSSCLNSRRRLHAARGRDWSEVSAEIVADNGQLIRRSIQEALAINQEFPTARVDWREIVQPPGSEKVMPAAQPQQQRPEAPADAASGQQAYGGRLGQRLNGHTQLAGAK